MCAATLMGGLLLADAPDAYGQAGADPPTESPDKQTPETDAPDSSPDNNDEAGGDSSQDEGRPTPSADKLLDEASAITDQVARIRGLPPRGPIDKGVKTREELRKILVEKLAEEQSKRQMRQEAAVYRKLGLLPEEFDYREAILDVLTEQIAGFYDQKTGELNIMVGIPLDLQRPAMAHEIFHAVQDQHFDLTRMLKPFDSREHGDFQLARSALVEGDATVLMIDFSLYENGTLPEGQTRSIVDIPMMANMLKQLDYDKLGAMESLGGEAGMEQLTGQKGDGRNEDDQKDDDQKKDAQSQMFNSALSDSPAIIRRSLIFPYLAGMRFVIAMRADRSWQEFNKVYNYPPVSTEQILHPDRYASRDEPVILEYDPSEAVPSHDEIYDTVMGEFQMRLFLEHHLENREAPETDITPTEASSGWDGDRLLAYRKENGDPIVVHLSVWDTRRDAREYYNALDAITAGRFPEASVRTASGKYGSSVCYRHGGQQDGERVYLERWGDAVLHVEGAPSFLDEGNETDPTAYQIRHRVWETLDRRPFRDVYEERMAEHEENAPEHADD
jgi:hypothetical protein